jgi:lipopolysaccharide transport system ATP-binding protein
VNPSIQIESLSKRYTLGARNEGYGVLRDSISQGIRSLFRPGSEGGEPKRQDLWALKDVSFTVGMGEVVGIIGGNGAGKSTILKLISEITDPTEGVIRIRGRVGSLLEVGTGFHPELSGRENIFLNGAILGMARDEIKRRFDEIVDFSGVERFLDTPLKRYSSGMSVRLAFAVAAHLEPEILLVDEVLAVGDAEFQKKCLGKMKDVTKQGRTILFVSHNMPAVRNLCDRVILLESGRVVDDGEPEACIRNYLGTGRSEGANASVEMLDRLVEGAIKSPPIIRAEEIAVRDADGLCRNHFGSDEVIRVCVKYRVYSSSRNVQVGMFIVDDDGRNLMQTESVDSGETDQLDCVPGVYESRCTIPANTFGSRTFHLSVHLSVSKAEHLIYNSVLSFEVDFQGYNLMRFGAGNAYFRPCLEWKIEQIADTIDK